MRRQALTFSKMLRKQTAPGRRYIYGEASLGELNEAFWSSTIVWTAGEYKRQWVAAARLCLDSYRPVLLYTDVGLKASMAYHVVPAANGLLIFEQGFRTVLRPLTRESVARELLSSRARVSHWNAPLASLHSLATSR